MPRTLGPWKLLFYQVSHIRVKKKRNLESCDQQNDLVIFKRVCNIRLLHNEVPLYWPFIKSSQILSKWKKQNKKLPDLHQTPPHPPLKGKKMFKVTAFLRLVLERVTHIPTHKHTSTHTHIHSYMYMQTHLNTYSCIHFNRISTHDICWKFFNIYEGLSQFIFKFRQEIIIM